MSRFQRDPGLLREEECKALAQRAIKLIDEPWADVLVYSYADTQTSFARGDAYAVRENHGMALDMLIRGCSVYTTRTDDEGIVDAIKRGKEAASQLKLRDAPWKLRDSLALGARPVTYFEDTIAAMEPDTRTAIYDRALAATEAAGLIGAGDLHFHVMTAYRLNSKGFAVFRRTTYGEFSLTARTSDGKGSGWGWSGFEQWKRVDVDGAVRRAIDLAKRSANPSAVEPGRYTVILEPTAVASLVTGIDWIAFFADQGETPFSKKPLGTNKIGLQMLDRRVDVVSDPWDPDMPSDIVNDRGEPSTRVVWFEDGVLRELYYDEVYGAEKGRKATDTQLRRFRWSMKGDTQTLDEMIASTKRGVWVNRLSGLAGMNGRTQLLTGTTRDGTFLIENGKITRAIKNFRFNESPFFVLNKLEAFGVPERAQEYIVAPRVKVRDFEFTSLTDAV